MIMDDPIEHYISSFPERTQTRLRRMRSLIKSAAPDAIEKISYRMPTFFLNGNLVHFAGYDRHVGFYPTPSAISAFKAELDGYKSAKGSVQFPLDKPLPEALIRRMVRFRVGENARKASKRP
jgi:uncharacterized protein YdhG (YjbR/CyaY superfamily)